METQLFVFLMCAVTALSLRFVDTRSESASIVLGATMFLSVLCRPEAVVYAAGTIIGLRLATTNTVRELLTDCKRESVLCPAVFVSLLAGYGAWKFYYFGYLLPNSFYLKSVGVSLLPGLPFVLGFFEHVGFWMGLFGLVPFLLVCRQVPQFLADREVRAKIILVCLPPILAWLYYCTIVHEVGFASRFSYPTYFYLTIGGTALVHIARQRSLASQSYRVGYEWFAAGVVIVVVVLRVMFPGPWSVHRETTWRLENLGPDAWGVYHTRIARALQASQLEEDATVITGAAGLIPYVSRMRHVDPVGLTDNRLSGRYPLTAEEYEEYLWSQDADVYIGWEPPATDTAMSPDDEPLMDSPYVEGLLRSTQAYSLQFRHPLKGAAQLDDLRPLIHHRMRRLRDSWIWLGEVAFGPTLAQGELRTFIYVRRASPHVEVLSRTLTTIIDFSPQGARFRLRGT